jgi:hypothetical protein
LAHWLTDDANPVTARVAANDIWLHLFRPRPRPHPQRLSASAAKNPRTQSFSIFSPPNFAACTTAAKPSSKKSSSPPPIANPRAHALTSPRPIAENRLLARQNRFRVDGEIVSDLTLAAAGLLSPKIGGPSVFPPLPPDVAALSYANNFQWKTSPGQDRYRRAMYTFFKRTAPHPNLTTFDCPDSNATTISRTTSNTPLQALVTLNNEIFAESAQSLSKRILTSDAQRDQARLQFAFRLCCIRPADPQEISTLTNLLNRARDLVLQISSLRCQSRP